MGSEHDAWYLTLHIKWSCCVDNSLCAGETSRSEDFGVIRGDQRRYIDRRNAVACQQHDDYLQRAEQALINVLYHLFEYSFQTNTRMSVQKNLLWFMCFPRILNKFWIFLSDWIFLVDFPISQQRRCFRVSLSVIGIAYSKVERSWLRPTSIHIMMQNVMEGRCE